MAKGQAKILIIDDESDICELLEFSLRRSNFAPVSAPSVTAAKKALANQQFDFCITDMRLPDGTGLELIEHIQQEYPNLPVVMITAFGCIETAIDALKAGAYDFLTKPVDLAHLTSLIKTVLRDTTKIVANNSTTAQFLGKSQQIIELKQQVSKLARSFAPVYISGESGTGKELVAKMIHEQGLHADFPFVPVNCGAIPSELMESEFFGHKKGSFTGANADKKGLFQTAQGGTLFLDEVADLPLSMQVKLLRAIQEKAVRPVGASSEVKIDVRILSATHKNLAQMVERGEFRQDLYYRLNVIELNVPPLRVRFGDIELLSKEILKKLAKSMAVSEITLSKAALEKLKGYDFPGNVRELENMLERAIVLCSGNIIDVNDLVFNGKSAGNAEHKLNQQAEITAQAANNLANVNSNKQLDFDCIDVTKITDIDQYLADIERKIILKTLEITRWNRTCAAQMLGINLRSMRHRLKKLEIE